MAVASALPVLVLQIAVVTPYNAQVAVLREQLSSEALAVAVRSVDGFQGQEREAVVMSMVRSNTTHQVGFLADHRRINVAVTRARRHVCIVGDSDTVSSDRFLKKLYEHVSEHGDVRWMCPCGVCVCCVCVVCVCCVCVCVVCVLCVCVCCVCVCV